MKTIDVEAKSEQAKKLHSEGFNCAQSVVLSFVEELNIDSALAERIALPFGGGVAKMGEICGCVSGMAVLSGFVPENMDENGKADRKKCFLWIQQLTDKFRNECGDIVCRRLKGIEAGSSKPPQSCKDLIGTAARLVAEKLNEE